MIHTHSHLRMSCNEVVTSFTAGESIAIHGVEHVGVEELLEPVQCQTGG